jgi:hypothetical protein
MNFSAHCSRRVALALGFAVVLTSVPCGIAFSQPAAPVPSVPGKAADNHIYAQQLVREMMAQDPDLVAMALHSIPPGVRARPGEVGQVCIASTLDKIGEADSPDDLEVAAKDQVIIGLAPLGRIVRLKVAAAFRDRSGRILGYCMISFRKDVDPLTAHERADKILRELAARIPDSASLFRPTA